SCNQWLHRLHFLVKQLPLVMSILTEGSKSTMGTDSLDSPQSWVENPHRIIRLWEIMRTFQAGLFLTTLRMLETASSGANVTSLTIENQMKLAKQLSSFVQDCVDLDLTATAVSLRRLIERLSATTNKPSDIWHSPDQKLRELVDEVTSRLLDEAHARIFFSLSALEAEHYVHWQKGWEEILARFPATTSDVEEASKCFALGRNAATV